MILCSLKRTLDVMVGGKVILIIGYGEVSTILLLTASYDGVIRLEKDVALHLKEWELFVL